MVLHCDASSFGLGVALHHIMPDGSQRPIAFASKTMSAVEKQYSQIEKEAYSIVFGVKKFHRFLFGRPFTLVTDHKPLLMVLGPKGHIASVSASRLHRWAVILSAYDFNLEFRLTNQHTNADFLSRHPLPIINDPCVPPEISEAGNTISFLNELAVPSDSCRSTKGYES